MKLPTNIKAFTLAEALINLLLISIVISLTYTLITLIGKQLTDFENENNAITNYNIFNTTLLHDIYKAHSFSIQDNQLKLKSYAGKVINYNIQNNTIYRQNTIKKDTFNVEITSYNFTTLDAQNNKQLNLKIILLKDTISANYQLIQNHATLINKTIFDEN